MSQVNDTASSPQDERNTRINELHHVVQGPQTGLEILRNNFAQSNATTNDHLGQLHAQFAAIPTASGTKGPRLPKAGYFEGNRSKLRGFLTQMDMHIDLNRATLSTEPHLVIPPW
ncbi:hypothetical protein N7461_002103 [Penicillium sp. DV-2018c]|nr:hypothetical protein N7461_002103 [Penicillium sp. DV-2018c]